MKKLTYKSSGVDIQKASLFKQKLKALVRSSLRKEVIKGIGGFGAFFAFAKEKYKEPILVSSADGVGTKLKVALLAKKHDTVGIDAVAMNVNDILCTGAAPLFFLDYIAYSKLSENILLDVLKGLSRGCVEAGCALIGGETAQMPGMYKPGEYDLAGFCVGVVERKEIIDGRKIKAGDIIIGLASSGLHSNGFSLVRKIFSQKELKKYSSELLKPTRIYVKPVLHLLRAKGYELRAAVHGISHITGGAFYDKIARILPRNVDAVIDKDTWPIPKIFPLIQEKGRIEDREMFHTFNLGIGLVLIVAASAQREIMHCLAKFSLPSWVIGQIVKGKKRVRIVE